MRTFRGKSVFGGIAIGKISVYKKKEQQVKRVKIEDADAEIARYNTARETSIEQLGALYEKALKEVGEANAAIFEIHQMMLEDDDYNESVENIIRIQMVNAEYAVASTADNFSSMFAAMDDDYMKARAADVKDISERILTVLNEEKSAQNAGAAVREAAAGTLNVTAVEATVDEAGVSDVTGVLDVAGETVVGANAANDERFIIVADDLAPSETVQLDKGKVLSFVTAHGSTNSHTAILARTMGIPALIGTQIALDESVDGKLGIVDGQEGVIYVEPEPEILEKMQKKQRKEQERKELLQTLRGKENVTKDGRKIRLYANIGDIKDLAMVLKNDAGGIGLFRSEFIYLEKEDYPTEEEQFQIYKTVAETMAGKRVIIRTLDIGADKRCDYFQMEKEENPALGRRAIRICLTQPEVFKTQLRALFRASVYGKIAIMYPMIANLWEVQKIKEIVTEVKQELTEEGISFGDPEQGIMIETPAAVMMSAELAKEVDFFSIGTNDLTQYTLAIDRQNPSLDLFYDAHHPAVLRMIGMVVENAHKAGIWAGICGELGADESLTEEFLKMGVDELSVSPGSILPLRKIVRETDVRKF